ncbi:MAG: high-affinity branched-chain amino acid ABC transporter ATP-binding protein LivG [Candidatus Raymondbacteria bacterium RifOxyA12_full_50_37]|uniref:High-affinity branched-chain amino acid ABC transporter ATP-binding protein LivG n=1 Tax=Candidatus Raymondbacteria bacterium RIFOXYD12_FULL_49_13 TaxID=1817890 RepID=A0A1F7F521_UNCRA|nr:MAG: high-affinity branched-chain amino acid ABC transporter ATP-binding protein LivG [Candidatus Raymondbacteria bacterium RIFOXYA2_FULL_49_16]OGJ90118.1 MAG: high-affinity branched-chain amino acid ABC transporter ATP-binding protein LivG [Candidatus Raymondbacteria bacterium RifOxyA12_full_50_37]OGJ92135.1 MAG: high-affinity branched-chain amino acid ABC transporter ATP-binding protein LivG [Candidatus Raymondbacteria bacterium RifOxyB12_full_50_8]OGJ97696.1 MAG: high-affinity branched-cha
MALLEVNNLSKFFGGLKAVSAVSFDVPQGNIKAIIGPNGAGKTTLFNLIAGSIRPDCGSVRFKNSSIFGLPPYRIAQRGILRTFQNIKLFPNLSVLENVMAGMHVKGRAGLAAGMLRLPQARAEEAFISEKAHEMLAFFNIGELAKRNAAHLSFGQQRAVEFARALASGPALLLLDEPAAGLNTQETAQLASQIAHIRGKGVTILIVEHDMSLIMDISDEIVVVSSGQKIAEGKPSDIQRNADVVRVYLGEE